MGADAAEMPGTRDAGGVKKKKGQRNPLSALLGRGKNTWPERQGSLAEDFNNQTIT